MPAFSSSSRTLRHATIFALVTGTLLFPTTAPLADVSSQNISSIVAFVEAADGRDLLRDHGITSLHILEHLGFALIKATPGQIQQLSSSKLVRAVEPDAAIEYTMDTAALATRVRAVQDGAVQLDDHPSDADDTRRHDERRGRWERSSMALDGTSVGIAIVDTGVDCTHPDLAARCVPGRNLRCEGAVDPVAPIADGRPVVPCTFRPANNTDEQGHGTHVAGIAVGTGDASDGLYRGVAPGADLYVYSHGLGATGTVFDVYSAWDHILGHRSEAGYAPIRIVSNSFLAGEDLTTPESGISDIAQHALRRMVEANLLVIFSAGNRGGGLTLRDYEPESNEQINAACLAKDEAGQPLRGLVCVGNYADGDVGSAEGAVTSDSSRGKRQEPSTWPDLVAPGLNIMGPAANSSPPGYIELSGTSMAAPHVAGVAALVMQARPDVSAAEVDDILKQAAYAFTAFGPFPNHHAGHGLVDGQAAVEFALAQPRTPVPDALRVNIVKALGAVCSGNVGAGAREAAPNTLCGVGMWRGPSMAEDADGSLVPGSTAIQVSTYLSYPGFTATSDIVGPAHVVASVQFSDSGRTVDAPLPYVENLYSFTPHYRSDLIAYDALRDGDVEVFVTFDLRSDESFDLVEDGSLRMLYRKAV